ncbi:hypothetical protein TNCV_2223771 [Trichonephila clavipes]|nr:hypothetical protein TNCV_2223771 [Trichonephila clavipes]
MELVLAAGLSVERELKNLGFHIRAATHIELTVIELWTCVKPFFGVMNLVLQSGSRMDASGFGGCSANVSLVTALFRLLSLLVEA